MNRVLVAGLGSESRGDDAAGLLAVRRLRELGAENVDVEEPCDSAALVSAMLTYARVVIVDAVAGGEPGAVLELAPEDLPPHPQTAGHDLDVRHSVEVARALGAAPVVTVIGIAGREFGLGQPASAAVVEAADEVAVRIKESPACA